MRNTAPRRYNSVNYRNNMGYIRGSAAPVLPQEDYPRYDKSAVRHLRRPKKSPVVYEYARVDEGRGILHLQFALAFAIFLVLSLCLLAINAHISSIKAEISTVNALTQQCQQVNERLEAMQASSIDLDKIKKIATTRLGMQTAAQHQIVTINVQKDKSTIYYDDSLTTEKKSFLQKIGLKK